MWSRCAGPTCRQARPRCASARFTSRAFRSRMRSHGASARTLSVSHSHREAIMTNGRRINHVFVLMLENRAFDHLFGFFVPTAGHTIENLRGAHSTDFNLLDPSKPESA